MADASKPNTPSKAQARQLDAVRTCRDVFAGTRRLREGKERYLPRVGDAESATKWARRLSQATLFNAFGRTVRALAGMVTRVPPKLGDDVPPQIAGDPDDGNKGGHWEDIDLRGTHGSVFVRERVVDVLVDGHVCVWVGHPRRPDGNLTLADQERLALRPYWVPIRKSDVLRWAFDRIGGRTVLTRFAFRECVTEPDGEFGEKEVEYVRDFAVVQGLVTYRVFMEREEDGAKSGVWDVVDSGTFDKRMNEIPVAVAYGDRIGILESRPPLEDLADECVRHFQMRSDFENVIHLTCVPMQVYIGATDEGTQKVAPDSALALPPGGDAKYLEPSGSGLAVTQKAIERIEGHMAELGLAMLERGTHAAETAEAKRIDRAASDSALSAIAESVQDMVERALALHAKWLGLGEDAGGSVTINRDFEALTLDPQQVAEYRNLVAEGRLSVDTLWSVLQQGRWLPEGFKPDVERDRLEQEALKKPAPDPLGFFGSAFGRAMPPPPQNGGAPGGKPPQPPNPMPGDDDPNARK